MRAWVAFALTLTLLAFSGEVQAQSCASTQGQLEICKSLTNAVRFGFPRYTTAQLPTCNANNKGAMAFDTTATAVKYCDGSAYVTFASSGGGTLPFSSLTSGTNTSAAMLVGTGASLGFTGTGTIAASTTNIIIANEAGTGTTANYLAKLTGAPSTAIVAGTSDTQGIVGVVVGGAGTTGSATIARSGSASCVFDGATTAGDYVQISATSAGKCHDTGSSTYPASGQVLGRVLSTNGAGGTYAMTLHMGTQGDLHPLTGDGTNVTLSSGQLLLPAGTAALPSFSFAGDPDTGIFSYAANAIGFSTNGSVKNAMNSTGDFYPTVTGSRVLGGASNRWAQVFLGGNTVTSSTPPIDITQTANSAGTTFDIILADITDTASTGINLINLKVGGSSKFSVSKTGVAIFASTITSSGSVLAGAGSGLYARSGATAGAALAGTADGVAQLSNYGATQKVVLHTTGAPSVGGSCGTSPSVAGQDTAMVITAGTVAPTSCAVTFQAAWGTAPVCTANAQTTTTALNVVTTTTTVTVSAAALTASEKIYVLCVGY